MAYEAKEVLEFQIGSTRKPKWEVKDLNGNVDFLVNSATYQLKDKYGTVLLSGNCYVNNNDEDPAGNTIKTVMPTIDLSDTDIVVGFYYIVIHVYLDNGEDDVLKVNCEIVNY